MYGLQACKPGVNLGLPGRATDLPGGGHLYDLQACKPDINFGRQGCKLKLAGM